jgi:hypothetical protein
MFFIWGSIFALIALALKKLSLKYPVYHHFESINYVFRMLKAYEYLSEKLFLSGFIKSSLKGYLNFSIATFISISYVTYL